MDLIGYDIEKGEWNEIIYNALVAAKKDHSIMGIIKTLFLNEEGFFRKEIPEHG
ncbi:hypothetical protein ACFL6K_01590 [Candidatus Latescibacterota bacterium]